MRSFRPVLFLIALAISACSSDEAKSPFSSIDAGVDEDSSPPDAGRGRDDDVAAPDENLGGPCVDDEQCDDGIACTSKSCDLELGRCRIIPDDSLCQDGIFCNGVEFCDIRLGCQKGPPRTCSDGNACTIDRCVEETQSCEHLPRDADGDGDPDIHCGGGDCDDNDPTVSSLHDEICANGKDDNCNGIIDEDDCVLPAHDNCDGPLLLEGPGSYLLSTTGASHDYSLSCTPSLPGVRDIVASFDIPEGPPRDVDIVARAPAGEIAIGVTEVCGRADAEIGCAGAAKGADAALARMRLRELGPGNYPLYLFADRSVEITLDLSFLDASPKPENETCGRARPLAPSTQERVQIFDITRDLGSACDSEEGDLVYSFTLEEPSDVYIRASSIDGLGKPIVSLRDENCALPEDEISCRRGEPLVLFERGLAAGTYYLAVSATAPTELWLTLELSPPTEPPQDESCEGAPTIEHNRTIPVSLASHVDDIQLGCSTGFVDAAYRLDISEESDVLLVQRFSQQDSGAVQLALPACASPDDLLACGTSGQSPARASIRKLPAGEYRAIVESMLGGDSTLTAFVRPYTPPTLIAFADDCGEAVAIPPEGGFFQGNTANASARFPAGCDYGAGSPNGAPEQLLRLDLDERKRVVFDMKGSAYPTLLNIRKGPSCPGVEMPNSCSVGHTASRSYLDLVLEAGTYWIQVDGYAGASGPWFLDIRVVESEP